MESFRFMVLTCMEKGLNSYCKKEGKERSLFLFRVVWTLVVCQRRSKMKKEYSRRTCLQQCKPLVITLINLVPFFLINEAYFYVYSFAFIFLVRARNLNLTSKLKAL